jgi:hypothetical protein
MTVTAVATPVANDAARTLVMSRLRAASAGVREAQAAVGVASDHLSAEIGEARRAGVPWAEICVTTNLNRHDAMDLVNARQATAPEPAPADEPANGSLLMSVQEYAKHAGISEMTVYKRVRKGELMYTFNSSGRKRIIVAASAGDSSDAESIEGPSE